MVISLFTKNAKPFAEQKIIGLMCFKRVSTFTKSTNYFFLSRNSVGLIFNSDLNTLLK